MNKPLGKLHLNLKGEYFDAIKSGEKVEEFRLCTNYWRKRLMGRDYDGIEIHRGYPKRGDLERTICRTYKGWTIKTITHPYFGGSPVSVFAIVVNDGEAFK